MRLAVEVATGVTRGDGEAAAAEDAGDGGRRQVTAAGDS
ncbi:hypothetical protein HNR30_008725 [Nonomuraea soli]|uniref:Uncharacterized protein n=1 Tax=Nonomuraea soli TaxID=1032476 RepID=A0A7W0CU89_9ACTN|nr:hypothetical protein [Nonomuraea soli]